MRSLVIAVLAVSMLFPLVIAGCAGGRAVNNDASTSAIRLAEETGASSDPSASYYLDLAKEELENAASLAAKGDKEEAEFMLMRAQADAELATVLSLQDGDKKDAARAIKRFQQLRDDYQLFQERK
jgi:hypothetical protein